MTRQKCRLVFSSVVAMVVIGSCQQTPPARLEIYSAHSRLRVGDQIHYTVIYRRDGAPNFVENYRLESKDPAVVRVVDSIRLEAVSPGSAEVLFVGHANLDGWDHTAVAKPGIDRLVREFKARGHPVVYFVSQDYPFWYTEDRQPDLAVVSEGQEHQIVVDAERVVFSGGDFMVCTLRNVQMTLHGICVLDWVWAYSALSSPHDTPRPPHVGAVLCAGAVRAISGSVSGSAL
jgi:hypothetical protein